METWQPSRIEDTRPSRGGGRPAQPGRRKAGLPGQLGKPRPSRVVAAPAQPAYGFYPGLVSGNPAWVSMCRPGKLYSGMGEYIPAQRDIIWPNLAVYLLFNIPAHIA
jgi:hypothetical protein